MVGERGCGGEQERAGGGGEQRDVRLHGVPLEGRA
jgi:hypothetical protein